MAIAFDANATGSTRGATSVTFSHTCSGSDRVLFVVVSQYVSGNPRVVTATYNGVSMTQLGTLAYGAGSDQQITALRLLAPATGTNDLVVSCAISSWMACASASFTGVDSLGTATTPTKNTNTTSITQNVTSESGDMVVDFLVWYNGTHTVGANQTVRAFFNGGTGDDSAVISTEAGAGTVTMSHSWGAGEYAAMMAVNMNAAAGSVMKVWNGSSWVVGVPKVWNGSSWVAGVGKVWSGSAWV